MYEHNGVTYVNESEFRFAEEEVRRQERAKKKRRITLLFIIAGVAVHLLLLGYTCAELLREARWHAHPHEHNESYAYSETLPSSEP